MLEKPQGNPVHMNAEVPVPTDRSGKTMALLELCHFPLGSEWWCQRPFNSISHLQTTLLRVPPFHSCSWGAFSLPHPLFRQTTSSGWKLHWQTGAQWNWALFALALLLSPAVQSPTARTRTLSIPHQLSSWGSSYLRQSGFWQADSLCPGLTHKLVLNWNGTAKAQ